MGLFTDSLKIGAGLTLGSAAAELGVQKTLVIVEDKRLRQYNEYRSRLYDIIVREDLCRLEVDGRLQSRPYPFPEKATVLNFSELQKDILHLTQNFKGETLLKFMKWHPWLTALLFAILIIPFIPLLSYNALIGLIVFVTLFRLVFNRPKKFKRVLVEDGKQYWHIREYIRQALEIGELNPKQSIPKLLNARLVQQFPDTIEEIEANAFNYRHGFK
ncbi:hypothetical protein [Streptococcus macacae]|uniref:Uncharacterized protein n=1 Tax=Streptococcus macacae NCTC 11558 TaxID=764298 RepID=G5JUZ2_9STRE|nr:hypothetical protein [Streptococcus macacae]EHJ51897.1 hypothetical protein STRMA_1377 [Streptococcus macacae NCTC 11558]SUN79289.1 Uncharacterised protein [Streptococcus macacae NCTC 11558]